MSRRLTRQCILGCMTGPRDAHAHARSQSMPKVKSVHGGIMEGALSLAKMP